MRGKPLTRARCLQAFARGDDDDDALAGALIVERFISDATKLIHSFKS